MMQHVLTLVAGVVAFRTITDVMAFLERMRQEEHPDVVDLAGEESFPASDPPPWTAGREPLAET